MPHPTAPQSPARPLSDRMRMALHKFIVVSNTLTAYSANESLGTLDALQRRGFLRAQRGLGSMAFPHTSIRYTITKAGLSAYANTPKEAAS